MIRDESLNPSGSLSAKAWNANSFLTSESARLVRGSGFKVKVSGAAKTRDREGPAEVREGKTFSSNWQF